MREDDTPLSFWRALRNSEFWLLLTAAVAGGFGVSGWIVIPASIAGLLISALPKYAPLYHKARDVGAERAFWLTIATSISLATVLATAGFLSGRFAFWVWGV